MWCSTSKSTCSLAPSTNKCARSGASRSRSNGACAACVSAPPSSPSLTAQTTSRGRAKLTSKTCCRATPSRSGKTVRKLSCRSTTSPSAASSAPTSSKPLSRTASGIVYPARPPSSRSKNHSRRCANDNGTSAGRLTARSGARATPPSPAPPQTARTEPPHAACAAAANRAPEPQAQAALRGQASRSPSAADVQAQQSPPEPCNPEAATPRARATPQHQSNRQPPPPHSQQAARSQALHRAQSPQPATHSHDTAAPPQSPQAQCENREPSPDGPHDPQTAKLHQTPTAPSPRCGTSEPPQPQTGPQQSAPQSTHRGQHSRDLPHHRICKAPQLPQQPQAQGNHPKHIHACSKSDGRSAVRGRQTMPHSLSRRPSSPSARRR